MKRKYKLDFWYVLQKSDLHLETEYVIIDTLCVILLVGGEVQLGALARSLLPTMQEFFGSERCKKIWEEHLEKIRQSNCNAA